jgi:PAS domain S-box-containing protein
MAVALHKLEKEIADRTRMEEALRQSEERYRTLVEEAFDGIFIRREEGTIVFANERLHQMLGYEKGELEGIAKWRIYHPDCREATRERAIARFGGENPPHQYEIKLLRKDGSTFDGEIRARLTRLADGPGIQVWIRDITARKRAEKALQESEEKFRNLVETTSDWIWEVDAEGKYTYASPRVWDLLGYEPHEVIGRKPFDFMPPDEAERLAAKFAWLSKERQPFFNWENVNLHKQGRRLTLETSGVPRLDTQGNLLGYRGIDRDITERKQAEEALRESEERLKAIFNSVRAGILIIDPERHIIVDANPVAIEMIGAARDQIIGSVCYQHVCPAEKGQCPVTDLGQKIDNAERVLRRMDGKEVPILKIANIVRFGGRDHLIESFVDITERRQAEEAVRRSEAQANQLAQENSIMAEIGRIIGSTLNIDEVYEGFAKEARKLIPFDRIAIDMLDFQKMTITSPYMAGKNIPDRHIGIPYPMKGTGISEMVRTKTSVLIQPENVQELKDRFPGLVSTFQAGFRSIMDVPLYVKGEMIGALLLRSVQPRAYTLEDIRLAERIGAQIAGAIANAQLFIERQRLEERLRRAEKMEALGTLAGGVAHDLNNVLGVLVGYSELLLMEIPEGNTLRPHVSNIHRSSQRAAAIIQDLLALARRGVSVSEVLNLNQVISDYFKTPEFEKLKTYHPDVTFTTRLDRDLMNIKGAPVHLGKTVMNLLSNAAEAISGRGEVTVVTENRYLDRPVMGYDHIQEGDYVLLTVTDTGKGISPDDIRKIFEPFYTKKAMGRSGTGLGLAVVWGTMKDHQGYIDVQSEMGRGSSFTLYFPVTREEIARDQKRESADSYRGRGESILVVDDAREQRELATAMLSRLGYRVSAVSSGEEALACLRDGGVDLLVLDMIMDPGMDGLETYRRVLEINPQQKAILVSGFSETDRLKEAQRLGAGAYVRKPYVLEKIGLAVRRELDGFRSK